MSSPKSKRLLLAAFHGKIALITRSNGRGDNEIALDSDPDRNRSVLAAHLITTDIAALIECWSHLKDGELA